MKMIQSCKILLMMCVVCSVFVIPVYADTLVNYADVCTLTPYAPPTVDRNYYDCYLYGDEYFVYPSNGEWCVSPGTLSSTVTYRTWFGSNYTMRTTVYASEILGTNQTNPGVTDGLSRIFEVWGCNDINTMWSTHGSDTSNPNPLVTFRAVTSDGQFTLLPGTYVDSGYDGKTGTTDSTGTISFNIPSGSYVATGSKTGYVLTNGDSPYTVGTTAIAVPIFFTSTATPTPTPEPTPTTGLGLPTSEFDTSSPVGSVPFMISADSTSDSGGSPITSYAWYLATPSGVLSYLGAADATSFTASEYGSYVLSLRVDNANGYDVSQKVLIVATTETPTPTPTATPVPTATTPVPQGGGTVSWDKSSYEQDDPATITYSIFSGFWDQSLYSYSIRVIDNYGVTKNTISVDTQTGTKSIASLNANTYPAGIYYANLHLNGKSDSTIDYTMNLSKMTLNGNISIYGYVMNAETGAILPGATILVSQPSKIYTSTSESTGFWNSSHKWIVGIPTHINTTIAGYTSDYLTITPLLSGTIKVNISLLPDSSTFTGVSIGGIVRDNQYGNPVPSATVIVRNSTYSESQTKTTNIAGYYHADNLYSGRWYDVWSSKTGYRNSTVALKQAVGT